jgi:hypothetical protein
MHANQRRPAESVQKGTEKIITVTGIYILEFSHHCILSVSRYRLRDPRGGAEGLARAAHGDEDAPNLPVRVQTGGKQAPGERERKSEMGLLQCTVCLIYLLLDQIVEKQRNKLHASVPEEKWLKHKRLRVIEKEFLKRKQKYDEARLKATKARNEYLLCMDAANSSIQKYFVDDLSDLIDVGNTKNSL